MSPRQPHQIALSQINVCEQGGPNRGPEVDIYLKAVGLDARKGSYPWCAAFVSWCIIEAVDEHVKMQVNKQGPLPLPIKISAGVFGIWNLNPTKRLKKPKVGCLYIIDHGLSKDKKSRLGHIGFVTEILDDTYFIGLSGNTNAAGSREGTTVLPKKLKISDIFGWVDCEI
jgi:hypothetical protein